MRERMSDRRAYEVTPAARAVENRVPGGPEARYDDELNLREHLAVLWRRRYVIVITTLAFGLIAFVVSRSLPRQYEATARLMINQSKTGDEARPQLTAAIVAGYQALLESPSLARRVVTDLALDKPPYNMTPLGFLNGVLSSQILGNTNIIVVHIRMDDPDVAAKIATAVDRILVRRIAVDGSR